MSPFLLHTADLLTVKVKQNRPYASGTRIYRHKIFFCHLLPPLLLWNGQLLRFFKNCLGDLAFGDQNIEEFPV